MNRHHLEHLVLLLAGRHWLVGVATAAITAGLGLGLIAAAQRARLLDLTIDRWSRLRRLVLLAALVKGGFYMLLGSSLHGRAGVPIIFDAQVPDPWECLYIFGWQTRYSIWRLANATATATFLVACYAAACLIWRALQMSFSAKLFNDLDRLGHGQPDRGTQVIWEDTVRECGLAGSQNLPRLIAVPIRYTTPLLIGIWRPWLVLDPRMVATLEPDELRMAFRHELAHFVRRDHRWRWLQLCAEDIAWPILFSARLSRMAVDIEEELCDHWAVLSPTDVVSLSRALRKVTAFAKENQPASTAPALPVPVAAGLLGKYAAGWNATASLKQRLSSLAAIAREVARREHSETSGRPAGRNESATARFFLNAGRLLARAVFAASLLLILAVKIHVFLNID